MDDDIQAFFTLAEVAERLRISPTRAYQLVAQGRIPHVRRGRRVLVPVLAWREWLAKKAGEALAAVSET
jgi:excisionase family DNA binding protein